MLTYRCLPGHGRANAAVLDEAGTVPWVQSHDELGAALRAVLRMRPTASGRGGGVIRAAAVAAAAAHAAPAALFVPCVRTVVAPALAGIGDPGRVALTFDDGPHPRSTPHFLSLLARTQTRATFFVLGCELARAPELGREIVAAGHELAVHGWDHRCFLRRTPAALRDDLVRTTDLIGSVTGECPR